MIYLIVGASLSGKSTIRQRLASQYGISGIDTDTLRTMTTILLPEVNIGHNKSSFTNYSNMVPIIDAFMIARKFFNENYILEGDCVNLQHMSKYLNSGDAKVVVLGYPKQKPNIKMEYILQTVSPEHWTRQIPNETLLKKITEFIDYSSFLQEEALKYNIPFINIDLQDSNGTLKLVTEYLLS